GKITVDLQMRLDPRAEWRQIYREVWRFERDYLYVPNHHGADWDKVWTMYEPWLASLGHRSDLTYLLDMLGGELSLGHTFVFGGDTPAIDEDDLRTRAWVEDNRRLVDSLSRGKLAYVWLPNTADQGYEYFNRYYFAQQDRQGVILDERFNGGGYIADYFVDILARHLR